MRIESQSRHTIPALEKRLAEEPIVIPGSPFWDVFRTFGRDELIALGLNTAVTAGLATATGNHAVLAFSGPVAEKAGFFAVYTKEAADIYRTTPEDDRESLSFYGKTVFKNGLPSLTKDILVHDPLYSSSLYFGLEAYPQTPAWMLSILTFIAAVGVVAAGEVAANETAYQNQLRKLRRIGFRKEPILEARFVVNEDDPELLLSNIAEEFDMGEIHKDTYHDRYYETSLHEYNARKPRFRLRERIPKEGGAPSRTAQVVYTRASEVEQKLPSQFNYFPTSKDKLRLDLAQELPEKIEQIEDTRLRNYMEKVVEDDHFQEVIFERSYAHTEGRLHASVDAVEFGDLGIFSIVEIKSDRKKDSAKALVTAMRHVMLKYDVVQTTHTKESLVNPL